MTLQQKCFFVYLIMLQVLALLAFLLGFFPIKSIPNRNASFDDMPTKIKDISVNPKDLYHQHVNKVILMVIDGLRYDFVVGENSPVNLPYVYNLINRSDNCLCKVRVETPTVTMPRIKALMTGNIPGFLDIIQNFKTNEAVEDNILRQATKNGLPIIFYGDETWINLFPHEFIRSERTTSFYVNDFYEVDDNVTRNVEKELNSSDWNIMILHYLGLDHIGHVEGPQSVHIKPKLNEMDTIIAKIHKNIIKKDNNNDLRDSILVICGDHGMRDSGGHGGSSFAEVIVPFLFLNYGCDTNVRDEEIKQIDLTSLLSVLLGLPIPAANLGKLNYKLMKNLSPLSTLYAMHYSTYSLKQIFDTYHFDVSTHLDFLSSFQKAENFFEMWIKSDFKNKMGNISLYHYFEAQKFMSNKMIELNINFDVYLMLISVLLLIQILWILLIGSKVHLNKHRKLMTVFSFFVLIFFNYEFCQFSFSSSIMCSDGVNSKLVPIILSAIFSFNTFLVKPIKRKRKVSLGADLRLLFLFLLHLLSYASSSYIEEEHQFWYFILTTICIYILISNAEYFSIVTLLIAHRFLQKLNQTGDKWAFVPDIGDWLNEEQNMNFLLFIYTSGQCALIYWCFKNILGKHVRTWGLQVEKLLFIIVIVIITLYRFSIGNLKLPGISMPRSRGIAEVQLFWICLAIQVLIYFVSFKFENSKRKFMENSFDVFLIIMLEIIALLHKPHNVLLIPGMLFFLDILKKIFCNNIYYLIVLYQSLGMVYYFYQGNSNGLATIDVAAGFVGLEGFNLILSGFFVFVNTFSALILSNILLLRMIFSTARSPDKSFSMPHSFHIYEEYNILPQNVDHTGLSSSDEVKYYWFTAMFCCLYITFYTILMTFQRYHLFVWTVFSPKLLYMGCEIILYGIILLTILLLEVFYIIVTNFLKNRKRL